MAGNKYGYKPTLKLSRQLQGTILAFNNKAKKIGRLDLVTSFARELEDVQTNAGALQVKNRLSRFLRPGAENLVTNKKGVTVTKWERNELNYAKRAANRARKELRENYIQTARFRQINDTTYAPFRLGFSDVVTLTDFKYLLEQYQRVGAKDYIKRMQDQLRKNLLSSVEWMKGNSYYDYFKNLFEKGDIRMLAAIEANKTSSTHIDTNYFNGDDPNSPSALEYSQYLVDQYQLAIKVYESKTRKETR